MCTCQVAGVNIASRASYSTLSRIATKNLDTCHCAGPDLFFSRVGKDAAVRTAVLPMATKSLQAAAGAAGLAPLAAVPLHVAAPAVGAIFRAVRALLPLGL
jgi:hypothetical protein